MPSLPPRRLQVRVVEPESLRLEGPNFPRSNFLPDGRSELGFSEVLQARAPILKRPSLAYHEVSSRREVRK